MDLFGKHQAKKEEVQNWLRLFFFLSATLKANALLSGAGFFSPAQMRTSPRKMQFTSCYTWLAEVG